MHKYFTLLSLTCAHEELIMNHNEKEGVII